VAQDSNTKRTRFSIDHQWTPTGIALFDTLDTKLYTQKPKWWT
jgi:hemoglobin/transferrin/lactoferrin receptor protein